MTEQSDAKAAVKAAVDEAVERLTKIVQDRAEAAWLNEVIANALKETGHTSETERALIAATIRTGLKTARELNPGDDAAATELLEKHSEAWASHKAAEAVEPMETEPVVEATEPVVEPEAEAEPPKPHKADGMTNEAFRRMREREVRKREREKG